ncbi:hypothetical protein CA11_43460 [Gimesia maris]|uniref:PHP domain-containing protein n=1 Tax=Gimesia maris TaxID=122 RepID=UPI0011885B4F|nr:PHP domain-containing protein [Gimesia maris]QDU16514.1 hypothetical protein CA11_43460 [Gimesia maris]
MKIDIHTHTKKCKTGDAHTRNVSPEEFCRTILSTEVKIIAITNHNVFDLIQFNEIVTRLEQEEVQVWPGIELDVEENGSRGHLLVIVSPLKAPEFSEVVQELTHAISPEEFITTIDVILEKFDSLKPLYVAHYRQKKPNISEMAIEKLLEEAHSSSCVLKEVTNSISAGIYISHGHASIYGSDIQNWEEYVENSHELPDLRLPVESFEHFCLLLKKDPTTINTTLDCKTSEILALIPFDDDSCIKMKVFNDINVLFGSKGTGKSCILESIAKHYSDAGIDANVYKSASDRLEIIYDTKGKDLNIDLKDHGIDYCTNNVKFLRAAGEIDITNLSKYVAYFTATNNNQNANKLRLKEIELEEESGVRREFIEFDTASEKTEDFLEFIAGDQSVQAELSEEELADLTRILLELLARLGLRKLSTYSGWKEVCLLNSAIKAFRREVERKTGKPSKPVTTGFLGYAMNRVKIELNATKIIQSVDTEIPLQKSIVGNLGLNKGDLEFQTEYRFQNGRITSSALKSTTKVKKTTQKTFINCVRKILSNVYSDDLFQYINELNSIEDVEEIKTVNELLMFKRYFSLNGIEYSPSSGEASMVMLQKELGTDKDIYILDEPEKSLGNEYINDIIVPLIKERALAGKKIFISTHDGNIAVRTLPYSSIYRCHDSSGYKTYVGNPFSNHLVNLDDNTDQLDWKTVSMKTLEGGAEAFGERGKIYGNN